MWNPLILFFATEKLFFCEIKKQKEEMGSA